MKTYIKPIARVIALYEEAELLLSGSKTVPIDNDRNVDEDDKSNRRSGIWDDF